MFEMSFKIGIFVIKLSACQIFISDSEILRNSTREFIFLSILK